MQGAWAVVADTLYILTGGPAFWFEINRKGLYEHNFSLCSRLGLAVPDYEALLVGA